MWLKQFKPWKVAAVVGSIIVIGFADTMYFASLYETYIDECALSFNLGTYTSWFGNVTKTVIVQKAKVQLITVTRGVEEISLMLQELWKSTKPKRMNSMPQWIYLNSKAKSKCIFELK